MSEERDDVMLDFGLYGINAGHVKFHAAGLVPDSSGCILRDDAKFGLGICRMSLYFKPNAELLFGRPDGGHFRASITRDHVWTAFKENKQIALL